MKKRILPFIFFALFVGFSFLLASPSYAGNPAGKGKDVTRINPMSSPSSSLNLDWQELGPINGSGRTRALIYDNRDVTGQTLYTGGVAGGIWKSTNLGLTWHSVTNGTEVLKVSAMAQTASGTIYVGTGEMSCFKGSYIGSGLYRSDDGENFIPVPGTEPLAGQFNSDWAYIMDIAIAPNGRIFAATSSGLKYSDNGNTWANALSGVAIDVEVGSDNTVLAAVDKKVYIARNGDIGNFINLSTGTPTALPSLSVGYSELAIAPSDPTVMYASLADNAGALLNVYASFDHGNTWSVIFPGNITLDPLGSTGCSANTLQVFPNDPTKVLFGGEDLWVGTKVSSTGFYDWQQKSSGYGFFQYPAPDFVPYYHHAYTFNPVNPAQFAVATNDGVSIATVNSQGYQFRHAIKGLSISQFVSVDASISQNAVIGGAEYLGIMLLPGSMGTLDPKTGIQINPGLTGQVAWSIIRPNDIFFATGVSTGPIARSEDMGTTIALTFNDSIENATKYMPIELWESFDFTATKDSVKYKAGINIPQDSTIIIPSNSGGFPIHYTTPADIPAGDSILIPDPIANRFFVAGGNSLAGQGIWMTKEALTFSVNPEWFKIASINATDSITTIAVSKDLGSVWAGTSKGKLFRLTNLFNAYNFATADVRSAECVITTTLFDSIPEFMGKKIASIAVSADNESVLISFDVYGMTDNVYLITNALSDNPVVKSVQGNMPAMPVYTTIFEMTNQNRAVIGTDYGVFATNDVHATNVEWTEENGGLGNVPVTKIMQQDNQGLYYHRPQNFGNIYIATLGRGIFYDSTYTVPLGINETDIKPVSSMSLGIYPNPFSDQVTLAYRLDRTSDVNVMVYDLAGRTVANIDLGSQIKGDHRSNINLGQLKSGSYIISISTANGTATGKALKVK